MKNWTISKRITLGFSILAFLTLLVGMIGFTNLKILSGDAHSLLSDSVPGTFYLSQIETNLAKEYGLVEQALRSNDAADEANIEKLLDSLDASTTELRQLYAAKVTRPEDREYFEKLAEPRQRLVDAHKTLMSYIRSGDKETASAYLKDTYLPAYLAYDNLVDGYLALNKKMSSETGVAVEKSVHRAANTILFVVIVAFLLAITIAKIIISSACKVLNHVIDTIDTGSAEVAAAATQTASASNSLAEGASEQASSLEETSASLEEIASMTASNAANAQQAKMLVDEMQSMADGSTTQMREMEVAMSAIKESSSGISEIIKTIDEIAFQTNILALNAAVEAARAGEAGAGFAVVAEEVRNLAQRSAQSAKETSGKIEGAVSNSTRGVDISAKVAQFLSSITEKAREMHAVVSEIANASEEQNKGIGQLTTAVQEMDHVTQTNASNAEETASASEELNTEAAMLRDSIAELASLVRNTKDVSPVMMKTSGKSATKASAAPAKAKAKSSGKQNTLESSGHFLPMRSN